MYLNVHNNLYYYTRCIEGNDEAKERAVNIGLTASTLGLLSQR